MTEGVFFAVLAFSGYGLFAQIAGRRGVFVGVAAAVPPGVLLWTILAIVLTLAGVQVRHAFWLLLMCCGLYCWASWRRGETLVAALAVPGTAMLVSLLSIRLGWIQLSFDSVEQIAVGRALAQTGLGNDLGTLLASWGGLLPLVQGASVFLGVDMLTALQPLLWLAFLRHSGRLRVADGGARIRP